MSTDGQTVATPWLLVVREQLHDDDSTRTWWTSRESGFSFTVASTRRAVWLFCQLPGGARIAARPIYTPDSEIHVHVARESTSNLLLDVRAVYGVFTLELWLEAGKMPLMHWTTRLVPSEKLHLPFLPRDLYVVDRSGDPMPTRGTVHLHQRGPRTGMLFATLEDPQPGALLYFQNLSALNDYCKLAGVSVVDTVGGDWPEMGFRLPATVTPLPAGQDIVVSDAFLCLDRSSPSEPGARAAQFFDLLATIYLRLPLPETSFHDWPGKARASVSHLTHSPNCTTVIDSHRYLLPYVEDRTKPPESMVQLTVLLPLIEYVEHTRERLVLAEELLASIPTFFDKSVPTVVRFLPSEKFDDKAGSNPAIRRSSRTSRRALPSRWRASS